MTDEERLKHLLKQLDKTGRTDTQQTVQLQKEIDQLSKRLQKKLDEKSWTELERTLFGKNTGKGDSAVNVVPVVPQQDDANPYKTPTPFKTTLTPWPPR